MKSRSIYAILLILLQASLQARESDDLTKKGENALASGLWEIAAMHFSEALKNPDLEPGDKSRIALQLAESWIREGKPAEALELLAQSSIAAHPDASFWKAQAKVALGRFADAVEILSERLHDPESNYRTEVGLTMARLQLSLGHPEGALESLSELTEAGDPALTTRARLRQVEIMLDLGRTIEAREIMPDPTTVPERDRALAAFLDSHLLLTEDRAEDAAAGFQSLIDQPRQQSSHRYHLAAVGLADALIAAGKAETAVSSLVAFIQKYPDSPELKSLFERLLAGLQTPPSITDPLFKQLEEWSPPVEIPSTGFLSTYDSSAMAAWPADAKPSDLTAFSIYTRALGLHRIGTPKAKADASSLLTRFRMEYPDHFLANRALLHIARWALEDNDTERAFSILDSIRDTAKSPIMRGEAAFLEAKAAFEQDEPALAVTLFDEAAEALTQEEKNTARLNAAIIRMRNPDLPGPTVTIANEDPEDDARLSTELELELALSAKPPAAAKAAIEEFLTRHPDHPRVPEARLAAGENALAGPGSDLSYARAQLEILENSAEKPLEVSPIRVSLLRLRIEDLTGDPAITNATARSIMETFPDDPATEEAAFVLGRNLFQSRNYNDARLVLEKLATTCADPTRAEAALLLAARSAALVPTDQSQQAALLLFDKIIDSDDSLTSIARMEKARLMIDIGQLVDAVAFLRKWYDSLPETSPLHLPAGLLLGEAIYAQGTLNPDSLTEALAVYDDLLVHSKDHPAVFDRLEYLRGRTLEQIPDPDDPSKTRDKQAFMAYYSVLERSTPPTQWYYFELCGFRALALLEKAGRWPAAIECAKKIASFKGPRAEEAATRASQLQLKHMIWED